MLTKQNKIDADRTASMMRQQESILGNLQNLIKVCEQNNLLEDVQLEDLSVLKGYCAEMQAACATADLLTRNLMKAYEAHLKNEEKKKAESEKTEKAKKQEPAPKANQEEPEEDDLTGFFDE